MVMFLSKRFEIPRKPIRFKFSIRERVWSPMEQDAIQQLACYVVRFKPLIVKNMSRQHMFPNEQQAEHFAGKATSSQQLYPRLGTKCVESVDRRHNRVFPDCDRSLRNNGCPVKEWRSSSSREADVWSNRTSLLRVFTSYMTLVFQCKAMRSKLRLTQSS